MLEFLKRQFRTPTMREQQAKQLAEAEHDLAIHQHQLEYYQAHVPMLTARVQRLRIATGVASADNEVIEHAERAQIGDMAHETRTLRRAR